MNALRELANLRDDHGLPSMGLDSMRREVIALKQRLAANDNQPGNSNANLSMATR